ncbi:ribosomal protein L24e family protein [Candidatus Woesearchaeota archaeon]|nr:ribosomal protein L24e family protein [Candidatus Woesearchaeota archaeon]
MPKCDFCGNSVEKGTGMMFVYVSGKIVNFCSRKCEKNMFKLGRKPLEIRWTESYRQEHKKGVKDNAKVNLKEEKA